MMKTKKQIRNLFLERFEILKCRPNQGFMFNQLYALSLTRDEYKVLIEQILPELEDDGIYTFNNAFFRLTEKGYDNLYINMKTEYDIANIIFDKCREFSLKSNQVVKWNIITEHLRKNLNPKELNLAWLVIDKLCQKEYIKLEPESESMPHCLRLLELGYDYMYDENAILDLSTRIQIIPDGIEIASNEAFNAMWEWIGEQNAPKYLTGSMLYNIILKVNKALPPTYDLFLNKRRKNNESTTRKEWLYEIFKSLSQEQKSSFFNYVESFVNQTAPIIGTLEAIGNWQNNTDVLQFTHVNDTNSALSQSVAAVDKKAEQQEAKMHLSVFISYSWDSESHKQWVLNLADRLCAAGIYVYLDQYDLRMGKDMTRFMENTLNKADRILVIGTPKYKERAMERKKGVGFEYSIISADLMNNLDTDRFIPILRVGPNEDALPPLLQSRIGAFMDNDDNFDKVFEELVHEIYNMPKVQRPPLGAMPDFLQKNN